jgi:hypothetical protein
METTKLKLYVMYMVRQSTSNMLCFKSNNTLYDCDGATVLWNVYIYCVCR